MCVMCHVEIVSEGNMAGAQETQNGEGREVSVYISVVCENTVTLKQSGGG